MTNIENLGSGRLPPQNTDAECFLLGSILISQDAFYKIIDKIKSEDFYEPRHRTIYAAILELFNQQKPIDILSLSNYLEEKAELGAVGGSTYLTDLTNMVSSSVNIEYYADIIAEKSLRRKLIQAGEEITAIGFDEAETATDAILDIAENKLFKLSSGAVKHDMVKISDILSSNFDKIQALHNNKDLYRGIPTGYADLDRKTAGLQRSDLIILAARPAMGKTTLAVNIAQHIATDSDLPVLIFSLEMSKEQLVDRMVADEAGIDSWNLRTGNLSDDDFTNLSHAWGTLSEAKLFIDDSPGMTVSEMRAKAKRMSHKDKLGLIVVDYLQLISSNGRGDSNRTQEISEISRGLKIMARELDVPVIALSQLSRSVESRNPKIPELSDLRESGSIEQDADIVLFLYREEYYNPDTDKKGVTDLFIKKHRNGPTGQIQLRFEPGRLHFVSVDNSHQEYQS
jgi:replicative DNA helicase